MGPDRASASFANVKSDKDTSMLNMYCIYIIPFILVIDLLQMS